MGGKEEDWERLAWETSMGPLRTNGTRRCRLSAHCCAIRVWLVPAVARCALPHPDVRVGQLLITFACALLLEKPELGSGGASSPRGAALCCCLEL